MLDRTLKMLLTPLEQEVHALGTIKLQAVKIHNVSGLINAHCVEGRATRYSSAMVGQSRTNQ